MFNEDCTGYLEIYEGSNSNYKHSECYIIPLSGGHYEHEKIAGLTCRYWNSPKYDFYDAYGFRGAIYVS